MKNKLQGMVIGIVLMGLFYSYPVLAAFVDKNITVQTGVKIYVNDNLLNPTDEKGNPVEPFSYNGTTYLPARAIAKAFDTDIKWEGKTGSVYIGKHKSNEPAVRIEKLDYFTGKEFIISPYGKDNLGVERMNVCTGEKIRNVYKINGKYTSIQGTLFQHYAFRSTGSGSELMIYGDDELLYKASMGPGIEPLDFNVDITGVLELEIYFNGYTYGSGPLYIGYQNTSFISDFGLYY